MPWAGVGLVWLLVSRFVLLVPPPLSCSIFLVSAYGRAWCAVFVSSFSCVIRWRLVVSFSFSSCPSSRLPVSCGRLVVILCGSLLVPFLFINSSASRLAVSPSGSFSSFVLFIISRCLVLPGLSFSSRLPVLSSSPCSLVLPGGSSRRFVERVVSSVFRLVLFFVLVSSYSLRLMAMATGGGSSFSSRGGVLSSPLSPVVESDLAMAVCLVLASWLCVSFSVAIRHREGGADGGNERAVRRYGGTRRFI